MKKFLSLFMVLILSGVLAFAQNRTVTGTVKDETGAPVPFATVTETGTRNATTADENGKFTITKKGNGTLTFTAAGFAPVSVSANGNMASATMVRNSSELSTVVVTALGIKRTRNSLPYAAQQIDGDAVSETRTGNAISNLSGKISGVEIRQGNGIGGSTNIVIRGTKSLTGNNQALFVVDGVPLNNDNTNTNTTGRGGYDYGNAGADINPDDIASVTVLKGAAATALYGSRGSNGVIMITTKKGKKGLGITVNSGVTFGSIDKSTFASYQNKYGAGYGDDYGDDPNHPGFWNFFDVNGDGKNDLVVPTTEDASYGPRFDPSLNVYHWDAFDITSPFYHKARPWVAAAHTPVDFYENSVSTNNNVSLSSGNDNGTFRLGYTRNDEHGVLPNSRVLKNNANFSATYNLTDRLTAAGSINFTKVDGKGRYGTGYDDWNVNQNFRQWYETNMDVTEQKAAYFRTGKNISWNMSDPSTPEGIKPIYTDNPYWTRYENYETDTRSRYFSYGSLNFKATDWLNFMGRVSLDTYSELQEERYAVGSLSTPMYGRYNRSFQETNYDLMANIDKNITEDFNFKALIGTNLRRSIVQSIYASTNGGLVVPKLYAISNSAGPVNAPTEVYQPTEVDGYYAGVTFGYKDMLFLDGTIRRDIASTLPDNANAYNYPSVALGWVFSKMMTNTPWLSYGKLRVNYAEVGAPARWGYLDDIYGKPTPFGSATLFSLPTAKANDNLKPERTKSKEIGLELAFLNSRVGLDATYYITNTQDQLLPVTMSTATGYSSKILNAGNVENKGFELSVYATPVKMKNFSWDIKVNYSRNRNKVVALYGDLKNLPLASFQGGVSLNAPLNQPFGQIWGKTFVIDSATGQKVVKSNGRYATTTSTTNVIGNFNPDWIGGIYNTFKFKSLALGFLIDIRQGGSVFSLDQYYGQATGIYPETAQLNDLGNESRLPISEGGGIILPGVTADGKPNTKRVANSFGTYGYQYNPQSEFVYDASYVKLRELTLTYSLPQSIFEKTKVFKGIDVSLIGRNLWIIHKNLPYSDPEENLSAGNYQGYQSGAYPTTRTIGFNLNLKF